MTKWLAVAFLALFVLIAGTEVDAQSSWVGEVRTGRAGVPPLEMVCKKLTEVNPYHAKEIKREVGIALAKDLLAVFSLPWMVREQHYRRSEGRGFCLNGRVKFHNGNTVMEALVRVLERSGASPKDIGQTPDGLRQVLLKDLKAAIAEVRRLYKEGYGSRSDFYLPYLEDLAATGMQEWSFSAQQLGLTEEEVKALRRSQNTEAVRRQLLED